MLRLMKINFAYVDKYILQILILFSCLTIISVAQASPNDNNQANNSGVILPIPKTIPSWFKFTKPEVMNGTYGKHFYIEAPKVGVKFTYEFEDETYKTNGAEYNEQVHRFYESVSISTRGWIYNQALCEYSVTIEPEFVQSNDENSLGFSSTGNEFSPDYLFSAKFLKRKPYVLDIYANQTEKPYFVTFQGTVETITQAFGGNFGLNLSDLLKISTTNTFNLRYDHNYQETNGLYARESTSDQLNLNFLHKNSKLIANTTLFYDDTEEIFRGKKTNTETYNALFTNDSRFLNNILSLTGGFHYRLQELDNLDLQNFGLNQLLKWTIRENLFSYNKFTYNFYERKNINSTNRQHNFYKFETWLRHILYENLITTAGVSADLDDFSGNQKTSVDPYLDLLYTRVIPNGNIRLGAKWDYRLTSRTFSDSGPNIFYKQNEKHSLSSTQEVYLKNFNTINESIIVTNLAGTVQYIRGLDYIVEEIDYYTAIRNTLIGDISDGQAVLVNYSYIKDSEYDDGIFGQNYRMNITFLKDFHLHLSYRQRNQDIIDGSPPIILQDDSIIRSYLRYEIGWSDTMAEIAEYERSSSISYQQYKLSQKFTYNWINGIRIRFSIKGYYGERFYDEGPATDDTLYGGHIAATWRINHTFSFRMKGYSQNNEDDIEDTINNGLQASIIYKYHLWSSSLSYEVSNQGLEWSGNESSRLNQIIRFDIVRVSW